METKQINGRKHAYVACDSCGESFWKRLTHLSFRNFCKVTCRLETQRSGKEYTCPCCGGTFYATEGRKNRSKSGILYCSYTCSLGTKNKVASGEAHPNWSGGKASYRLRALRFHGAFCSNSACEIRAAGITVPEKLLDVHHVDGNRKHNALTNLQVLCVWCHAKATRCPGARPSLVVWFQER